MIRKILRMLSQKSEIFSAPKFNFPNDVYSDEKKNWYKTSIGFF